MSTVLDKTTKPFAIADLFEQKTDFQYCIEPLLRALNWHGDVRHLAEALPFAEPTLDLHGFLRAMDNLEFKYRRLRVALNEIDANLAPFLFVHKGRPVVILSIEDGRATLFDPQSKQQKKASVSAVVGDAYLFIAKPSDDAKPGAKKEAWFKTIARPHFKIVYQLLVVSFFLNIFTVISSLFVMTVYDKVIGNSSSQMLVSLCSGMVIVIAASVGFGLLKSRILAYIGAMVDLNIGKAILQRLFRLPIYFIENTNVGAQISRIKDFDSVREFFTGNLFGVMFELPFVFMYILVIAVIAGPLAFVPLVLVLLYVIAFFLTANIARGYVKKSSELSSKKQRFLVEAINNVKAIKLAAGEEVWKARYADLSAEAALANFRSGRFTSMLNSGADATVVAAVITMLVWGVYLVVNQAITIGALIASLILIWRILNPLKMVFTAVSRLEQLKSGVTQINNLMTLPVERKKNVHLTPINNLQGRIAIEGLSHRYNDAHKACLQQIDLTFEPNKLIAITGPNGAGKSTLLKILIGLYPLQSGAIRLDDVDIRQYDVVELRHAIAYTSQSSELFHGSILDNIRLSNLTASQQDIDDGIRLAGLQDEVDKLPQGIHTIIQGNTDKVVSFRLRRQIALARTFAKKSKILLLDEPGEGIGDTNILLKESLAELKQTTTILMITHNMMHLETADEIVVLKDGQVLAAGPSQDILAKLTQQK